MFCFCRKILIASLILSLVVSNTALVTCAEAQDDLQGITTEILHIPIEEAKTGKRITIYTEISDDSGIDVVRVYFRADDSTDYYFVILEPVENREYNLYEKFKSIGDNFDGAAFEGILPAPSKGTQKIEYLILVKNNANQVIKTQIYQMELEDSEDDAKVFGEPIKVYTELPNQPSTVSGFTDNIVWDVVESSSKFGVAAGLYSTMSSKSGEMTTATVVASSGGYTTTAAVIGTLGVAAVVGGAVALASSSGGSSDSRAVSTQSYDPNYIYGTWTLSSTFSTCYRDGTQTFNEDGTFTSSGSGGCPSTGISSFSSSGSWTLNGTSLVIRNSSTGEVEYGAYSSGATSFQTTTDSGGFSTWVNTYTR